MNQKRNLLRVALIALSVLLILGAVILYRQLHPRNPRPPTVPEESEAYLVTFTAVVAELRSDSDNILVVIEKDCVYADYLVAVPVNHVSDYQVGDVVEITAIGPIFEISPSYFRDILSVRIIESNK